MREKRNILISIGLGAILGWALGFLRLPYLEKNHSFSLGFIACLSIVLLGFLLKYIWEKNTLRSNLSNEISSTQNTFKKYTFLSILTLSFILIGGLTSSFLFFQQNKFSKIKAEQLNKKLAEQFELEATTRKSNSLILINNLFDKIDTELKNNPTRILSDETIERIAALNYSFEPYQYFDGEKFSKKKWSPERGQLLLMLARTEMDSVAFSQIKSRISFLGADLRNADLAGVDLSEVDLRQANFDHANLASTNLNKANLEKASLQKTNLKNAKLNETNLKNTDMQWAEFQAAELTGVLLNGANLSNAKLRKVDLTTADLRWANLRNAFLNGANLTEANLLETDLSQANLEDANFTKANLVTTVFIGANLTGADLTEADLLGAKIDKDWLEKLDTWQVIGAKNIQESYEIGEEALPQYKYKLLKIKI